MKDHLLSWHEKFQPLGPALKTPRVEVDEKSAIAEFETGDHGEIQPFGFDLGSNGDVTAIARYARGMIQDICGINPSCTGGNAPSLSPQALVTTPAAQAFKKGDRVRVVNRSDVYAGDEGVLTDETCRHGFYTGDFTRHGRCYFRATQLEHISQPSDTQQWVEWEGGCRPVSPYVLVDIRVRDGRVLHGTACGFSWNHLAGSAFASGDIVAFRVVQ